MKSDTDSVQNSSLDLQKGKQKAKQSGIALLVVIVIITIISTMAADFAYNSHLELEAAANQRDQFKAEMIARSSLQFGHLLIAAQEQFNQQTKQLPKIPGFSLESIVITDYADLLLNLLLSSENTLLPPGVTPSLRITYDDGKFPLHCGEGLNPDKSQQRVLYYLLNSLFRSKRYDALFDRTGRNGLQINRENLPRWIIDWIDIDEQAFEPERPGVAPEESYSKAQEPYEAHNFYMDTIEELHLVHGMDRDDLFQAIADNFTVYHNRDCKASLAGIDNESWRLLSAILAASSSDKASVFDPNTDLVAKQLAPLIKSMWPMLRDQSLADIFKALAPGVNDSAISPPNGQKSFCLSPSEAACSITQPPSGSPKPSTSPTRTSTDTSSQALTNLSELVCSPFITKIPEFSQRNASSPIPLGHPPPPPPAVPLKPIPLCPGALALFLKAPSPGAGSRRFYRMDASGSVERGPKISRVNLQAIWDTSSFNSNPICDLPKCKRGTWLYFRLN